MNLVWSTIFLMFTFFTWTAVYAKNENQIILTKHYGIFSKKEQSNMHIKLTRGRKDPEAYTPKITWECFTRNNIQISLETLMDFEDINFKNPVRALIEIKAKDKKGNYHIYSMRRAWPAITMQTMFSDWVSLMEGEKYICIGGMFVDSESEKDKSQKHINYNWYYEKLKTKKGCHSYFSDKYCQLKS